MNYPKPQAQLTEAQARAIFLIAEDAIVSVDSKHRIILFNEGHYYKCHDALEEAWQQDKTPGRDLYRGVLQYGIALYQIERGNFRGAVKMLLRLRQWLDPLPDVCRGVQVARLRQNISQVTDAVQRLGADNLIEFDFTLVEPILFEA